MAQDPQNAKEYTSAQTTTDFKGYDKCAGCNGASGGLSGQMKIYNGKLFHKNCLKCVRKDCGTLYAKFRELTAEDKEYVKGKVTVICESCDTGKGGAAEDALKGFGGGDFDEFSDKNSKNSGLQAKQRCEVCNSTTKDASGQPFRVFEAGGINADGKEEKHVYCIGCYKCKGCGKDGIQLNFDKVPLGPSANNDEKGRPTFVCQKCFTEKSID